MSTNLETIKNSVPKLNGQAVAVRVGFVLAGIGVLALLLPLVYYAFLSALGLLGLGITAGVGVALIKALPWLGQKWENKLLSLRKAEARGPTYLVSLVVGDLLTQFFEWTSEFIIAISGRFVRWTFDGVFKV